MSHPPRQGVGQHKEPRSVGPADRARRSCDGEAGELGTGMAVRAYKAGPPLPLADDLRLERASPIPRHVDLHPPVGSHRPVS
jgi:hypothetical protein